MLYWGHFYSPSMLCNCFMVTSGYLKMLFWIFQDISVFNIIMRNKIWDRDIHGQPWQLHLQLSFFLQGGTSIYNMFFKSFGRKSELENGNIKEKNITFLAWGYRASRVFLFCFFTRFSIVIMEWMVCVWQPVNWLIKKQQMRGYKWFQMELFQAKYSRLVLTCRSPKRGDEINK